jgi:lipoate-protein ligase B
MRTRAYVARLENFIDILLNRHMRVPTIPSEHTGTFTSSTEKIGSIGIQLRHRITSHGFSVNIEEQVVPWFNNIVVCGLDDVRGTSAESCRRALGLDPLSVDDIVPSAIDSFGEVFERPLVPLEELAAEGRDPELLELIEKANAAATIVQ